MSGFDVVQLLDLLNQWGYPVMFLLAVIEGPVVMMLAGALVSFANFNPLIVLVVLVVADLVGDALYYAVGRYAHGPIGRHVARWIGLTDERAEVLKRAYHKHHAKILYFAKTQAIGSPMLYMAGAMETPFWAFIWYNFIGTVPKAILFEAVGYYFGKSYMHFNQYLSYAGIGTLLISLGLIAVYWWFKRYIKEQGMFS